MDQAQELMVADQQLAPAIPQQARDDAHLLELWLHGKSPRTRRVYEDDVQAFLAVTGQPIGKVMVKHLHAYQDGMIHLASATVARRLSAVKSMLSYAQRLGYVRFNVGAAVKLPKIENTLAERMIESRDDVSSLVILEPGLRNRVLLRLLYVAGLRISEACGLEWRHLKPRSVAGKDASGQVSVFGKGGKTRIVLLPGKAWRELQQLRPAGDTDAIANLPVFASREGGALDPSSVHRVVKAACARAGLSADISAHWLRHAHASHALEGGAPIHLLQATLGHASVATTSRYLHAKPGDSSALHLGL